MKTSVFSTAAVACGVALSVGAGAQTMQAVPLDMYACSLKEGVTYADVDKMDEKFVKWVKKNDSGQTSWRFLPQWREDSEIDLAYLATWENGAAMAKGMKAWTSPSGREVGMAYGEIMDCNHSLAASMPINVPEDYVPGGGIAWFSRCTLAEDATMMDAMAAHKEYAAEMAAMGSNGLGWMVVPSVGFGDTEFDYYHVAAFEGGYEAFGAGFDTFYNGGGMQVMMKATDGVVSCASPNVYDVNLVVSGAD